MLVYFMKYENKSYPISSLPLTNKEKEKTVSIMITK